MSSGLRLGWHEACKKKQFFIGPTETICGWKQREIMCTEFLGKLAMPVALDPSTKEAYRYICDKQWSLSTGEKTFYLCCSITAIVKQMVSLIVDATNYAISWYTYVYFNNCIV